MDQEEALYASDEVTLLVTIRTLTVISFQEISKQKFVPADPKAHWVPDEMVTACSVCHEAFSVSDESPYHSLIVRYKLAMLR